MWTEPGQFSQWARTARLQGVVMIERLATKHSERHDWIDSMRGSDGIANLSDLDWGSAAVAIGDVSLTKIRLEKIDTSSFFWNCRFNSSFFSQVTSKGGFWGSYNEWRECHFDVCILEDVISPGNLFEDCTFRSCGILGYQASKTVFRRCVFEISTLSDVVAIENREGSFKSIKKRDNVSVRFEQCVFTNSTFIRCAFRNACFSECQFTNIRVESCSFDGIDSDTHWWGKSEETDLFVAFLDEVIRRAELELGPSAKTIEVLVDFRHRYQAGEVGKLGYSEFLYGGRIPDAELDCLEPILDELEDRHNI